MGLMIMFYSRENEPVHVHCKYQDTESKAEIMFENGKFVGIEIKEIPGKEPLITANMRKFKKSW